MRENALTIFTFPINAHFTSRDLLLRVARHVLAMMERVAVYVGGTAALCAAVYVLFGPDRLWKRQGTCILVCGVCNSRILL